MRKKRLVLGLALVFAFALVLPSAGAFGAETVSVTYRTPFFLDQVREIEKGSAPEQLSITDVHGVFFGTADKKLITDNLELDWFTDEGMTEAYGFDEAVNEDLTLFGKLSETKTYSRLNGYGWDVQNGRVYAGDPVDDYYITSNEYQNPNYTDPADGSAIFAFPGIKYAVYGRGMDVLSPFDVTLDFTSVTGDSDNNCWFQFSLFPSLTCAQAGVQGAWANAGAASCMMFGIGTNNLGVSQVFKAGETRVVGFLTSTTTTYENSGSNFKRLFLNGNMKIALTIDIGETETLIKSGETVVARSPAKRADFPAGTVYMSFANNGGGGISCEFEVSAAQSTGLILGNGDSHCNVGEVSVAGMAMTAEITVADGYEISKITANETDSAGWSKVVGRENVYAIGLKRWYSGPLTIDVETKKIETQQPPVEVPPEGESGGCGKESKTAGVAVLALLGAMAAAGIIKFN